jgi:hypothetical protein
LFEHVDQHKDYLHEPLLVHPDLVVEQVVVLFERSYLGPVLLALESLHRLKVQIIWLNVALIQVGKLVLFLVVKNSYQNVDGFGDVEVSFLYQECILYYRYYILVAPRNEVVRDAPKPQSAHLVDYAIDGVSHEILLI